MSKTNNRFVGTTLSAEEYDALDFMAKREKRSKSATIKVALEAYLKKIKKPVQKAS